MARRRVEPDAPAIQSWAGADEALRRIRELDAEIAAGEAAKAAELTAALARHDAQIVPRIEQRDALGKALEEFTRFHRADLGDAQSKPLNHGTVGFRIGQRALATLAKWTWAKVLDVLIERKADDYIAIKKSVDREAILGAKLSAEAMRDMGLKVVREERFYYATRDAEAVNPDAQAAS